MSLFIFLYWCSVSESRIREIVIASTEESFVIDFAKSCIFGAEVVAPLVARISTLVGMCKSILLAINFCLNDEVKNLQ